MVLCVSSPAGDQLFKDTKSFLFATFRACQDHLNKKITDHVSLFMMDSIVKNTTLIGRNTIGGNYITKNINMEFFCALCADSRYIISQKRKADSDKTSVVCEANHETPSVSFVWSGSRSFYCTES